MTITMSGAKVDTSKREELYSHMTKKIDTIQSFFSSSYNDNGSMTMGESARRAIDEVENATSTKLAGITPEFATAVSAAIDKYCEEIETTLNKLQTADTSIAFKGSQIGGAINNFVEGVKNCAFDFLNKLKEAEQQIVESVQKAYATQDTDISGSLSSDTSSLQN